MQTLDEFVEASKRYYDSLDQTKLALFQCYNSLAREYRASYEREFWRKPYERGNGSIDYWLNIYRICRDARDQLATELFDIEEISS